ncbi:hypothetical protein TNCV_3441091 [Trichonephila clavipes]|uniref:Uncharacterized protein n=1 Tax=Trichonephila clavipes TaxID=2585209 RepID=A0A8X7BFR2_TRICX|nr:hypothetical protein TNCV_3441091 [Trichonephila clavipes]
MRILLLRPMRNILQLTIKHNGTLQTQHIHSVRIWIAFGLKAAHLLLMDLSGWRAELSRRVVWGTDGILFLI